MLNINHSVSFFFTINIYIYHENAKFSFKTTNESICSIFSRSFSVIQCYRIYDDEQNPNSNLVYFDWISHDAF